MKPSLQLRVSQQLSMTPQLQQAIRLLQLSTLELQQEIQAALESNLMLEEAEESDPADVLNGSESAMNWLETEEEDDFAPPPAEREIDTAYELIPDELPVDVQWQDIFDGYPPLTASGLDDGEGHDPLTLHSRPQTLHEHLVWQLNLSRLSERELMVAHAVVDAIDAEGYLRAGIDELAAALDRPDLSQEEITTAIHRVQSLDPPGVGARDLAECLIIQLRQLPETLPGRDLALAICTSGFAQLARGDVAGLARLLKAETEAVSEAAALIRRLNPRPGRLIEEAAPEYVVPDILVHKHNGRWQVELNPEITPRLRINADYARLVRRADQSAAGLMLKSHLQEARWFIKSLASRNETVLRVGAKIVELQQDFLEHGEEWMRPLVLRDVAEALGLHESTVSRVTTQKYMLTPRGTFELKYFFSSHVTTLSGGECSATAIRALIRKLIAAESPGKPLSDQQIARALASQGIQIARRTVAKYREAMGIPASSERKRLA
ncbi:RNA polymerase factor sigma-54 [Caldichromatium japonicum]|uniref:RNA polymerase sigma-54 factor n=1 Tax=Caldichromatium japonicum TaxID=2699430 RepID=A0A6G7VAG6_9GAMM|nr:RNA polymerase factor sigma-54 [Caldichromatium japonicum]QIK36942.1 RNA polymerase factor sigma-54 [Caldichromatium japonicum]